MSRQNQMYLLDLSPLCCVASFLPFLLILKVCIDAHYTVPLKIPSMDFFSPLACFQVKTGKYVSLPSSSLRTCPLVCRALPFSTRTAHHTAPLELQTRALYFAFMSPIFIPSKAFFSGKNQSCLLMGQRLVFIEF